MKTRGESSVEAFGQDILNKGTYTYTDGSRLSSRMATEKSRDSIIRLGDFSGCSLIDIGCGDGHFTMAYHDVIPSARITGIDASPEAIGMAKKNSLDRDIVFECASAHALPYADGSFDVALLQSILHHDDSPELMINEAFRVAQRVVIHEPNGYNLGLKAIERLSPYHRSHHETSYTVSKIRGWINDSGGEIENVEYLGFVPMFAPDWLARSMKFVEPVIERTPFLNMSGAAVFVILARRRDAEIT